MEISTRNIRVGILSPAAQGNRTGEPPGEQVTEGNRTGKQRTGNVRSQD